MPPGERFNTWSHLFGAALTVVATPLVFPSNVDTTNPQFLALLVYIFALLAVFSASALFHGSAGSVKRFFEKLDHASIYILIPATLTPFAVTSAHEHLDIILIGLWTLSGLGILREVMLENPARILSLTIYLVLGWLCVAACVILAPALHPAFLAWILAGAACYSLGTIFYVFASRIKHSHGVWHLCVVSGAGVHFVAVWRYASVY